MVTDKSGKSLVIEQTEEGLKIFDNPVGVMTNAPSFDWHLINLTQYAGLTTNRPDTHKWSDLELVTLGNGSGAFGLPGDSSSQSRFVKTAFLKSHATIDAYENCGIVEFFNILSAPFAWQSNKIILSFSSITKKPTKNSSKKW